MILADTLTLDAPRMTTDGYLAVRAKAARAGVYEYSGAEVDPEGKKFARDAKVNVYRPADEVFDKRSVHSFIMKPVTDDHPTEPVTADNWKSRAKGVIAGAMRDGDHLAFDLVLMDRDIIDKVKSGKRELSNGYAVDLSFEDGTAPDGTAYQAVQRSIVGNHIAVVDRGRAGPECRIADCVSAPFKIGDTKPMKTIVHDGISIEFADQAADAYNSLKAKLDATAANIAKLTADIAAKDAELAKRDATIDGLKAKVLDGAALDAAVAKRADLIATARAIHDADYTGKSEVDIRRAVLSAKGIALDGKSDAYIEARFDALAEDAKADGRVRDAISSARPVTTDYRTAMHDAAFKAADDMNAWRTKQ